MPLLAAARSFLRTQWPLLVLAFVCSLLLLAYQRWIYRRKAAWVPYRVFDLVLVWFLLAAIFCVWTWCHLRHARTLREMRLAEDERLEAGPERETQILSFLQRRRDLPDELADTDYIYEQMAVNLFLVERTGCIERTMRGEPKHPGSFKPIKVSFMSNAPPRNLYRNMTFEWLDRKGDLLETRWPLRTDLPDTKNGIRGVVFSYKGFDDEFWSRRRLCWPDSMTASDFFMFYLDQFMHVEGTRVDVNFFADRPVKVSLETVSVDATNPRSLRRRPVRPLPETPPPESWSRVPQTHGRALRTAASWRPFVLGRTPRENVALVVHYGAARQAPAD